MTAIFKSLYVKVKPTCKWTKLFSPSETKPKLGACCIVKSAKSKTTDFA